jgi:hypothetical protein
MRRIRYRKEKEQMSMMRRRVIAIIAAALAIIILGFSLAAVLEYVETMEFVDVDGETKYYAKKSDGVYKLYAKGAKEPLKTSRRQAKAAQPPQEEYYGKLYSFAQYRYSGLSDHGPGLRGQGVQVARRAGCEEDECSHLQDFPADSFVQ